MNLAQIGIPNDLIIKKYTRNDYKTSEKEGNDLKNDVITTEAVVHAYDDVAPDENDEENMKDTKAQPVRKAPAPPIQKLAKSESLEEVKDTKEIASQNQCENNDNVNHEEKKVGVSVEIVCSSDKKLESQEDIYGVTAYMDEEVEKGSSITVNSNSSGNTNSNDYSTHAQVGQDTDIERTGSHHSYEEIPPSEANSEVI